MVNVVQSDLDNNMYLKQCFKSLKNIACSVGVTTLGEFSEWVFVRL